MHFNTFSNKNQQKKAKKLATESTELATPCRGVANAKPGHSEPFAALKGEPAIRVAGKLHEESIKNACPIA